MRDVIDLTRWPIDKPETSAGRAMIARCKAGLAAQGMFNLDGFLTPNAVADAVAAVRAPMASAAFHHKRRHNVYFQKDSPGITADHPALALRETSNRTICADQLCGSPLPRLYEWPVFAAFLAVVMEMPALHPMADPLARINVMAYRDGEALNWHFDRSEFTTTLLLQAPVAGGAFEYRKDLRSADDPNYDGVARLLRGEDPQLRRVALSPGTLNVFRGRNTAHRVTPVEGGAERIIAVFSYFDRPGVTFSDEERLGFYGRTG